MSGTLDRRPADLDAVPRTRSAVIEASAGTGKTYLIEHLALDLLIANGMSLSELLLVTFTEKATRELKSRLRQRIRAACAAAATPGALDALGWRGDAGALSRLRQALTAFDAAAIATLHGFCDALLAEHAFAGGRLLEQQRVDGRTAFGAAFREALRGELTGVPAERAWLQAWLAHGGDAGDLENLLYACWKEHAPFSDPFDETRFAAALEGLRRMGDLEPLAAPLKGATKAAAVRRLRRLAELAGDHAASGDIITAVIGWERHELPSAFAYLEEKLAGLPAPFAELRAASASLSTVVAQRFLPPVTARLEARKQAAGQFDFDDMLELVAQALDGPRGPSIVESLRRRFRFAVVDEFQDTDQVQWRILRRVFFDSGARSPLLVVGDPKQAIYGFRGADVAAYLAARKDIGGGAPALTLDVSYRSHPRLVDALNLIFDDAARPGFFSGRIRYAVPVRARPGAAADGGVAPLRVMKLPPPETGKPSVTAGRAELARRQAAVVRDLLAAPDAPPAHQVFVLTRSGSDADQAARALREVGVPCVQYKREGLFQTAAAGQVRDVLAALADPQDRTRRLRALMTPFLGVTPRELPRFAELPDTHPMAEHLRHWTALAGEHRYRELARSLLDDSGVGARVLLQTDGRRQLTDLQHVLEVLLAETAARSMTVHELVQMLQSFIDGHRRPASEGEEKGTMRLETEAAAVQVMTMHASKGLEAEVVVVFTGLARDTRQDRVLVHHRDGTRQICLAVDGDSVLPLVAAEQREEEQRLLYVALTRAKRLLILPWLPGWPERDLGCYLDVNRRLSAVGNELVQRGLAVIEEPSPIDPPVAVAMATAVTTAATAVEDRSTPLLHGDHDELVRRARGPLVTSYTRMKRERDAARAEASPTRSGRDEPAAPEHAPPPLPEHELPAGAATGVFLHALLEKMPLAPAPENASVETWAARPEVAALLDEEARAHRIAATHLPHARELVWRGLHAGLQLAEGGRLAGLHAADGQVAREMEFLYPLPGGDSPELFQPRGQLELRPATGNAGGPVSAEPGYVHGYLDVILEHGGRLYVLDWKSDALPGWDEATVRRHVEAHYDVQIQLYTFAALRMLGVSGEKDMADRFGGIQYVFLRGLETAPEHASLLIRPSFQEIQGWWTALRGPAP